MLRLPLLLVVGIAALAASTVPPSDAPLATPEAKATHTLTIDYQQQRGDMRRAMLKIAPKGDDARPLWRGPLDRISVLTTKGQWIIIESFLSSGHSSGHHAEARVMLPPPDGISAILLHPKRGGTLGWKVEEGESYTEVEWTYLTQRGERTDPPRAQDGDDEEEEPCSTAGCTGIVDPSTCECYEDIRDPWENEVADGMLELGI